MTRSDLIAEVAKRLHRWEDSGVLYTEFAEELVDLITDTNDPSRTGDYDLPPDGQKET